MLDFRELNAKGVRARQAMDVLRAAVDPLTMPQQAVAVNYAYATFSNLMRVMEQEAGVVAGYFGSAGAVLPEINPFDGVQMPPAVSHDEPMFRSLSDVPATTSG